ncbi:MAG: isopentenyl-diphosphate Delta-isomerase [Bacteroidota bacterium]
MKISNNNMNEEHVVLVDEQNQHRGTMEKMEAHLKGELHRAFSVFVFNSHGELMLHRRATHKYHSGGLWTNTCCSHPRPGETLDTAVHRRLVEEMGFDTDLRYGFSFLYHQQVGELIEHELDHVWVGTYDGLPQPNPEEVDSWKFMAMEDVRADMDAHPERYTVWFRLCFDLVDQYRTAGFPDQYRSQQPIKYIA